MNEGVTPDLTVIGGHEAFVKGDKGGRISLGLHFDDFYYIL